VATIHHGGQKYELQPGESVLDGLLRNGVAAAHACKSGSCGSCMMRVLEGELPSSSQPGLKDSWKAQGYFLPCVCVPNGDLTACEVGSDARVPARVTSVDYLSADVLRVGLRCEAPFEFQAGQYLTVISQKGLARSYSIASLPDESSIELHVRLIPNGRMSGWLSKGSPLGAQVQLQGPSGECFYVPGRSEQAMLLVGTGTGLAPLYGIVREALRSGHSGDIHLVHGALRPAGLYLRAELAALAAAYPKLSYTPVVLNGEGESGVVTGSIDAVVAEKFSSLAGWRGFVCGDPGIVRSLKKKLFLAGMPMRDIYSDAFLPSA
jgi:CDP-4-dehydro-6-deoxyglucose reductase